MHFCHHRYLQKNIFIRFNQLMYSKNSAQCPRIKGLHLRWFKSKVKEKRPLKNARFWGLKISYFGVFGPFLGPNDSFQLFSHHILYPTGPIKEFKKKSDVLPLRLKSSGKCTWIHFYLLLPGDRVAIELTIFEEKAFSRVCNALHSQNSLSEQKEKWPLRSGTIVATEF